MGEHEISWMMILAMAITAVVGLWLGSVGIPRICEWFASRAARTNVTVYIDNEDGSSRRILWTNAPVTAPIVSVPINTYEYEVNISEMNAPERQEGLNANRNHSKNHIENEINSIGGAR